MVPSKLFAAVAVTLLASSAGYVPTFMTKRSTMTMRKGRKSLRKTVGQGLSSSSKSIRPMGGDDVVARRTNWVPVAGIKSMSDLPQEENKVKFVDTMADRLIDGAVNPTGAVSVINYDGKTYCFASSCSSCKIPLTKAKVLPPNEETGGTDPRISCDFCSATFNVRTGKRLEDAGASGLLGGIVKGLMGAKEKENLRTYDLGERDGKVLINLP